MFKGFSQIYIFGGFCVVLAINLGSEGCGNKGVLLYRKFSRSFRKCFKNILKRADTRVIDFSAKKLYAVRFYKTLAG
jgi:hypothetical protein